MSDNTRKDTTQAIRIAFGLDAYSSDSLGPEPFVAGWIGMDETEWRSAVVDAMDNAGFTEYREVIVEVPISVIEGLWSIPTVVVQP